MLLAVEWFKSVNMFSRWFLKLDTLRTYPHIRHCRHFSEIKIGISCQIMLCWCAWQGSPKNAAGCVR